jgi:ferric-dicitrate binding protein FerR (iron transport regulator)
LNPEININSNADIEEAVAWKNGLFMFDGDNIQHIMRMVSRWYDVEVEYKGAVQDDVFGGSVSRFENVSEVLKILQLTGKVHFKIEGRKILVSK